MSINMLIQEQAGKGNTIVIIEHHLDTVLSICDRVIFINSGTLITEGKPEEIQRDSRVIEAYIN